MNIAICEDEIYFATYLKDAVKQYLNQRNLCANILIYSSGEELLCSAITPDIILMDIKLSGKNGMETIKKLRNVGCNSQVIFITSYPEYVFQAFDVDAIHYLSKPLDNDKFLSAIDKAWKRVISDNVKTILLTNRAIISKVRIKDIIYCEVFNHQTIIHTITDRYNYSGTLDALEKELDNHFFRCHRSYIINLDYVINKESGIAVMTDGSKVLISRRKQQKFTIRLLTLCRKGD